MIQKWMVISQTQDEALTETLGNENLPNAAATSTTTSTPNVTQSMDPNPLNNSSPNVGVGSNPGGGTY